SNSSARMGKLSGWKIVTRLFFAWKVKHRCCRERGALTRLKSHTSQKCLVVRGRKCRSEADMSTSADISALYREFTDSLTEVLAETAGAPVRRGRLARSTPEL